MGPGAERRAERGPVRPLGQAQLPRRGRRYRAVLERFVFLIAAATADSSWVRPNSLVR